MSHAPFPPACANHVPANHAQHASEEARKAAREADRARGSRRGRSGWEGYGWPAQLAAIAQCLNGGRRRTGERRIGALKESRPTGWRLDFGDSQEADCARPGRQLAN